MTTNDLPGPVAAAFRAVRRLLRSFEAERVDDGKTFTATWNELRFIATPDELDGGWVAECLDLPGCMGQGDTERQALEDAASAAIDIIKLKVREAIEGHRHDQAPPAVPHQVSVAI